MLLSLLSNLVPALAVLLVVFVLLLLVGAPKHALSGTIATYVIVGVAIFAVQSWSGGVCLPETANGSTFWARILNWPYGFYDNVWKHNGSFRQYILPGSCSGTGSTLQGSPGRKATEK